MRAGERIGENPMELNGSLEELVWARVYATDFVELHAGTCEALRIETDGAGIPCASATLLRIARAAAARANLAVRELRNARGGR